MGDVVASALATAREWTLLNIGSLLPLGLIAAALLWLGLRQPGGRAANQSR